MGGEYVEVWMGMYAEVWVGVWVGMHMEVCGW